MAVADVFRVKMSGEGREGEWCMTFHYQELTPANGGISTKQLSEGVADHLTEELRACLSNEHQVARWKVDKLSGTKTPNATFSLVEASRVGLQAGAALPAHRPAVVKLFQVLFPPKSDGQVWMSGIPGVQVNGSVMISAYLLGPMAAFLAKLNTNVPEPSAGEGLWRIVVLSRKFLLANPGDFAGAAADVASTGVDSRLGRMESRRFGGKRRKKIVVEEEPPPPP